MPVTRKVNTTKGWHAVHTDQKRLSVAMVLKRHAWQVNHRRMIWLIAQPWKPIPSAVHGFINLTLSAQPWLWSFEKAKFKSNALTTHWSESSVEKEARLGERGRRLVCISTGLLFGDACNCDNCSRDFPKKDDQEQLSDRSDCHYEARLFLSVGQNGSGYTLSSFIPTESWSEWSVQSIMRGKAIYDRVPLT